MRAWPCQAAAASGAFAPITPQRRGPLGPTRCGSGRGALGRARAGAAQFARPPARAFQESHLSSVAPLGAAALAEGLGRNPSERSRSRTGPSLFSPGARLAGLFGGLGRRGQSGLRAVRKSDGIFFPRFYPLRFPRSVSFSPLSPLFPFLFVLFSLPWFAFAATKKTGRARCCDLCLP